MHATLRALGAAFLLCASFASTAWAADLDAEVLLVRPDHSGQVPKELASMRKALQSKGYSGAKVDARRTVHLSEGRTEHVTVGRQEVDLTLLGVKNGSARVHVAPEGRRERVTTVSTTHTRFLLTVAKKR